MQPVAFPDELDSTPLSGDRIGPPPFLRVAVLCRLPAQGPRWGGGAACALADSLVADGLTHFDYFPLDFTDPQADGDVTAVFAGIAAVANDAAPAAPTMPATSDLPEPAASGRQQPFDAIVIAGGPDIDSDIGLIHRVLAPAMRAATLPVLCALGADDAKTILGDTAWRVFADPPQLLEFIAAAVRPAGLPAKAILEQIGSLAHFLLTEQTIETHILRDAALLPALQRHVQQHEQAFDAAGASLGRGVERVQVRLLRETGRLEQSHARIGVEVARVQQRGKHRGLRRLQWLRLGVLLVFACLSAALWLLTAPATAVFFSGCALVLLSAAYVGIGNLIADRSS